MERAVGARDPTALIQPNSGLGRAADRAEDLGDLAAQEDEGDDRNDRDEREDQRVLREALAFLVSANEIDDGVKHVSGYLLSVRAPRRGRRRSPPYGALRADVNTMDAGRGALAQAGIEGPPASRRSFVNSGGGAGPSRRPCSGWS